MQSEEKKELERLLLGGVDAGVFPGAAAGVVVGPAWERQFISAASGRSALGPEGRSVTTTTYFDLASLTKPLATVLAVMALIKAGKLTLAARLTDLWPGIVPRDKGDITIRSLLAHCSGLPAYQPFYLTLMNVPARQRREKLRQAIMGAETVYAPWSRSLYSDIGFMILGLVVEDLTGMECDSYVAQTIFAPLALSRQLFFHPETQFNEAEREEFFAATEQCPWRKRMLWGEVHDENCFALGGAAGHAGLFGSLEGVLALTGFLLDAWQGTAQHPHLRQEDFSIFMARQAEVPNSTWALGFDTVSAANSSAGSLFSRKSIGHLGFTGTSFWIDPELPLVAVLLTNRVHPSRDNSRIRQFRPHFHNAVHEMARRLTAGNRCPDPDHGHSL